MQNNLNYQADSDWGDMPKEVFDALAAIGGGGGGGGGTTGTGGGTGGGGTTGGGGVGNIGGSGGLGAFGGATGLGTTTNQTPPRGGTSLEELMRLLSLLASSSTAQDIAGPVGPTAAK